MKLFKFKKAAAVLMAAMMVFAAGCSRDPASESSDSSSVTTSSSTSSSKSSSSSKKPSSSQDMSKPEIKVQDNVSKVKDAQKVNADVGGYLYIPNTTVDEPVLSAKNYATNQKFWDVYDVVNKRLNWKKEMDNSGVTGCLYLPKAAGLDSRDDLAYNTVIFGHNPGRMDPNVRYDSVTLADLPDAMKFAQLYKYLDEDFAKKNPYIYFSTENENYIYQVFAAYYTEAETTPKYYSSKLDAKDSLTVANEAVKRSLMTYKDVKLSEGDKFLTLSTCTYAFTEGMTPAQALAAAEKHRFVIMAKLLPANARGDETANVSKNPSPKMPEGTEKK
ncbi:MAG: class B sortase [Oscillospiraceae bacterium]|nr:class B sortase [Oscillospiraceae bacterium]